MATNELDSSTTMDSIPELIDRFLTEQDEGAFACLVERHADLVMGVCTRVLGDKHLAEDAFQATFMVLARNARKVRKQRSLSSWLFGVAYRVSLKSRKRMIPIPPDEPREPVAVGAGPLEIVARRRDEEILDEELHQLSAKHREVLVLHYLEELRNAEIADRLAISETAVEGRLKRGRAELRGRLLRRGIGIATFVAILTQGQQAAHACVTPHLIADTVVSAVPFAKGVTAHGVAAHQMAQEEVLRMIVATKKWYASWFVGCSFACIGLFALAGSLNGQRPDAGGDEGTAITTVQANDKNAQDGLATQFTSSNGNGAQAAAKAKSKATSKHRIKAALRNQVDLEFVETPLSDVVDYLRQVLNISVMIDHRGLEDIGLGGDEPITLAAKKITAKSGLKLALEPLDLTYAIRHDVLMITSKDRAEQWTSTEIYRLNLTKTDPDGLIELITKMIAPDSWDEVGGPGSISVVPSHEHLLVIRQTEEIHEEIETFLETLRAATDKDAK